MKILAARFLLLCALLGIGHAAPLSRNVGQGLVYHRVHQLPADLPTAEADRRQPCILDLRYATGDAEAATALAAWLKFHATSRAPVFVLANSATSRALISAISPRGPGASVVVLGAAGPEFTPDIPLKISADADRRAYDAFANAATVDALITESPDKPRNDEAKLAKDWHTDPTAAPTPAADAVPPSKPTSQPIDAVLQRAVQLHRALLALKKL